MSCTDFGNLPIILFLIGAIYWCWDKKLGEYLLISLAFTRIINSFIKLTACVYRPWVADSRIHPFEGALDDATGYSLPSGHANSSGILFLGTLLKGNLTKGLKVFPVICLFLIAFSRCYLGVHSLLDIIVALVVALVTLILVGKLFEKFEDMPNFDLILLALGIIFSILLIAYTSFKGYPMDYDAAGKLIVDPVKMAIDAYKDVGFCMGILISWVIERRFIKFSCEGPIERRILRVSAAYVGYLILMNIIYPLVKSSFSPQIANLINFSMFPVFIFYATEYVCIAFVNCSRSVLVGKICTSTVAKHCMSRFVC